MNDGKRATWRKSSHSTQEGGQCIELAALGAAIAVRDSTDPTGPILDFGRPAMARLVGRIRTGELN
ncbi:DUF397 domain-containing protein [Actinomadura sp. 7K507]|uniref:DUF397 domain-containing protein n=1 Tax=Actinomadura sp. 7K507 TaxID=2530365 RepID=UPI001FB5E3B7|nr:DUF397 domain-containing protein [Actinomadura sp. 7K507]